MTSTMMMKQRNEAPSARTSSGNRAIVWALLFLTLIVMLKYDLSVPLVWKEDGFVYQQSSPSSPSPLRNDNEDGSDLMPLPPCEELMSRPNSIFATGDFISRIGTPHVWNIREDGSREFQLRAYCTLKRYTASEAKTCLAGKHISFIGDSLTRYQFISLVYFLHKDHHPEHFARRGKCPYCGVNNSVAAEGDWGSFDNLYSSWGGNENGGVFDGQIDVPSIQTAKFKVENEEYKSRPTTTNTSDDRVTVTFFTELGWGDDMTPLRGFNFRNCSDSGTCTWFTPEEKEVYLKRAGDSDFDWSQPFPEAISSPNGTLRQRYNQVDYAIYNRGLWGKLNKERSKEIFKTMYDWTGNGKGRCFFKGTTAGRDLESYQRHETTTIRQEAQSAGCSHLDYGYVTSAFESLKFFHPGPPAQEGGRLNEYDERLTVYWDSVHFQPWVYEELNNILLNVICNWKYKANEIAEA